MTLQITRHRKLDDGSYLLVIDDGTGTEHEYRFAPLGRPMTESDYLEMQIREASALVAATIATTKDDDDTADIGTPLPTEGKTI